MTQDEMSDYIRNIAREMRYFSHKLDKVIEEMAKAEMVRKRLDRERPGFWDESVRLGMVNKRIGDAL